MLVPIPGRANPVPLMLEPFPATTERAVAPGLGWLGTVPVMAFLPARSFTDALTADGAELLAGVVDADVLAGVAASRAATVPGSTALGESTFAPMALRCGPGAG